MFAAGASVRTLSRIVRTWFYHTQRRRARSHTKRNLLCKYDYDYSGLIVLLGSRSLRNVRRSIAIGRDALIAEHIRLVRTSAAFGLLSCVGILVLP